MSALTDQSQAGLPALFALTGLCQAGLPAFDYHMFAKSVLCQAGLQDLSALTGLCQPSSAHHFANPQSASTTYRLFQQPENSTDRRGMPRQGRRCIPQGS